MRRISPLCYGGWKKLQVSRLFRRIRRQDDILRTASYL
jgi:hypothetical protein